MATSHDYSELYWAWNAWRAEVGAPAREDYTRYVELKNQAAIANGKDLRKKIEIRILWWPQNHGENKHDDLTKVHPSFIENKFE